MCRSGEENKVFYIRGKGPEVGKGRCLQGVQAAPSVPRSGMRNRIVACVTGTGSCATSFSADP
jgi:hypothetical protein